MFLSTLIATSFIQLVWERILALLALMEQDLLLPWTISPFRCLQLGFFKLITLTWRVFRADFPDKPPTPFSYTGAPLTANLGTLRGTRLSKVAFNSTIELVLQDTNLLIVESHPFHLHGYNFFVVGTGIGNFDPKKDPAKFNLVDPMERNTVGVPTGGGTAIRFRADNPGIIYKLYCWIFTFHTQNLMVHCFCWLWRRLVYALPFGAPYWLGTENSIRCRRWTGFRSNCSSSSQGSSTLLNAL